MTRSLLSIAVLAAVLASACGDDAPAGPTTLTNTASGPGGLLNDCSAPPSPTGLRVTAQNKAVVELSWNAVKDATSYTLVVGSKPGGNDTLDTSTTQTLFRFTAKDGKQYARVQANNSCGDGVTSPSIEFVVVP